MKLLVATRNRGKLGELQALLSDLGVELVSLDDIGDAHEVEEDAPTFEGNATKKAREHAERAKLPTLADDSGLEVDAIDGAPGVISARYAGAGGSKLEIDRANNEKLLAAIAHVPDAYRTARFRCVLALALPGVAPIETTAGTVEGRILHAPRGSGGFGYDPLFLPDGETRTMAELPPDLKNTLSHRARAAAAMRPVLARSLASYRDPPQ